MPLHGRPGERISYTVYPSAAANAPPLVLLHGFTASAASFDRNVDSLRRHFDVIVPELLGHGDSDAPADSGPYAPAAAVERLLGLFDELGHEKVLLCGHSLGGALALRIAVDAPERLAGLVVMNSNSAAGTPEWREQARPGMQAIATRARAEGLDFMRATRLYPAHSKRLDPRSRELLVRDFNRLAPEGIAGTAEALVIDVNVFERLGELRVATLVILGDKDADFARSAPAFVARLPEDVVHTALIHGAGHAANIEQPEQFERLLLGFATEIGILDGPSPAPGARGRDFGGRLLTAVGAGLVVGGVGLLAAAFLVGGGGRDARTLAAAAPSPTVLAAVLAASPAGPVITAVAGTSAAGPANLAGQSLVTAVPSPTVMSPAVSATLRPTKPPATSTPTPMPTPAPAATATPVATPTPARPGAAIGGPPSVASGETVTFVDASQPAQDVLMRVWAAGGGATIDQTNPAAIRVSFPKPGCYSVSLTISMKSQSRTFAASLPVSVGGIACR